jgi:DNA topoisomerase-2
LTGGELPTNDDFVPYYEGFRGTVACIGPQKYLIRGVYERIDNDRIRITELPVGTWTMPYITFLEGLVDGTVDKAGKKIPGVLKDFKSVSTDKHVDILVQFPRGALETMTQDAIEKTLKLTTTVSANNMHMFNADGQLRKYATVPEIIEEFANVRLATYAKRKQAQVDEMTKKWVKLSNKARYILSTLEGKLDFRRMPNSAIVQVLATHEYEPMDESYNYLLKMPMDSVSEENAHALLQEKDQTERELEILRATSCEQMWMVELQKFEEEYAKYKSKRDKSQEPDCAASDAGSATKRKAKATSSSASSTKRANNKA